MAERFAGVGGRPPLERIAGAEEDNGRRARGDGKMGDAGIGADDERRAGAYQWQVS